MHPPNCPGWEYKDHPRKQRILSKTIPSLMRDLRSGQIDTLENCSDTRKAHGRVFRGLTPGSCDYFAGHYRGEPYRCLQYYEVFILSDPRVGTQPTEVLSEMNQLKQVVEDRIKDLDELHKIDNLIVPKQQKLRQTISVACKIFVSFLTTHPFADGNGHMGRFIVWCILGRYGYWPQAWPMDPRPPDPPYSTYIAAYRDGNTGLLERFVLDCVTGFPPVSPTP